MKATLERGLSHRFKFNARLDDKRARMAMARQAVDG
jgi:hypothetical protein